jgi:hypothetical protein
VGQPSRRSIPARFGALVALVLAGAVALTPAALAEPGSLAGTAPVAPGAPAADGLGSITVEQLVEQLLTEPSGTRKGAKAAREDAATRLARRAALFAVPSGDPMAAITSAQSLVFALVAAADPARPSKAPERKPSVVTAPAVTKPAPVAPVADEAEAEEREEKVVPGAGSTVVPPGCGTRAAALLLAGCLPGGTIPGIPGGTGQPCVTKGTPGAMAPQVCDPEASKPAPVSDVPVGGVPVGGCPELWKMRLPGDPCASAEAPHKPAEGDDGRDEVCVDHEGREVCFPKGGGLPSPITCQVWKAGGCDDPVGGAPYEMFEQVAGDLGQGDDASGDATQDDEGQADIPNMDAIRDAIRVSDAPSFLGAGL